MELLLLAFLQVIFFWAFCTIAVPVLLFRAGWRTFATFSSDMLAPIVSVLVFPAMLFYNFSASEDSSFPPSAFVVACLCPVVFIAVLFFRRRIRKELVACNLVATASSLLALVYCLFFEPTFSDWP